MSNNPHQRYGRCTVKADGDNLELNDISYKLNGVKREDIQEGRNFTETDAGGYVKGKVYLKRGQSVKSMGEMDDVTLVWENDTGQTYMAAHAWVIEPPEIIKDGSELEFHFAEAEEMTNG